MNLSDITSLRSTIEAKKYNGIPLPPAPNGKENYVFSIGQTVITTDSSQLKADLEVVIKDRTIYNGFCRYLAGGVWHTQNCLTVK